MAQQQKEPASAKESTKPSEQKKQPAVIALKAKIQKLVDNPESRVKAIASVNIGNEFAIHGIKIIESDKGMFISMPNEKWTDNSGKTQYKDTFHAVTAEARKALVDTVMTAYDQKLAEDQSQAETPAEEAADDELPDPAQEM